MKYIALLRGINVGGNSIIKMTDLKKAVEECGFTDVVTFIQSGNIIFDSNENNADKIEAKLMASLWKNFKFNSRIIIKTYEQFKNIVLNVPDVWKNRDDLRRYIAFIKEPATVQDITREIELNDGIDFIKTGEGVLYMSTLLSGLTRSRLTKIIAKKVYKDISIRNFDTAKKILALMER